MEKHNIVIIFLLVIIGGLFGVYVYPQISKEIFVFDEPKTSRDIYNDLVKNGCTITHKTVYLYSSDADNEIEEYKIFMKMSKDCVVLIYQNFDYNTHDTNVDFVDEIRMIALTNQGSIYYEIDFVEPSGLDYKASSDVWYDALLIWIKEHNIFPLDTYRRN